MTTPETMPIPACLSHLAQRDAAVRARALEEAAAWHDQVAARAKPNLGDKFDPSADWWEAQYFHHTASAKHIRTL